MPGNTRPTAILATALISLVIASCAPPRAAHTAIPVAPAAVPEPVEYRLSPVLEGGRLVALAVEIHLRAGPSGATRLVLPDTWADASELWRFVKDLEVVGATSVVEDGPVVRVIAAPAGAPLVVRYRVTSAYDHDPTSDDGQPFAPIIRPTFFNVFGEALFAVPEGHEDDPARFAWTGAPAGFGFASDLEHLAAGRPGVVGDVLESIVLGGPGLKVHTRPDGGGQLRVATLGEYGFGEAAFIDLALDVIAAQRAFWGDHGAPFLVAMTALQAIPGSMSTGGTGRSDAFALTVSQDAPLDRLRHILAHEYFHTWNPRMLGAQAEGADEMTGKWFSEGFTEFYAWRLLLRADIYTLEDFVAAWNAALREYDTSPVRAEPNARVVAEYWTDQAVGRLPYRRGPLLAALWEQRLRAATAGARDLDDVMLAMRDHVRAAGERKQADAAALFPSTYRALGGPDLAADLERFVTRGEPIVLPTDVFGDCVRVVVQRRRTFDRGWDPEATTRADNVITGLRAGTPAHRAGLRNGMKIVRREAGEPDDATIAYVLRVQDGERERLIEFMPQGPGEVAVQQLVLAADPTPARRVACKRGLAGE